MSFKPSGPLGRTAPVLRPRLQGPAPVMALQPVTVVTRLKSLCKCGKSGPARRRR